MFLFVVNSSSTWMTTGAAATSLDVTAVEYFAEHGNDLMDYIMAGTCFWQWDRKT